MRDEWAGLLDYLRLLFTVMRRPELLSLVERVEAGNLTADQRDELMGEFIPHPSSFIPL
jgi:hypothetical protein